MGIRGYRNLGGQSLIVTPVTLTDRSGTITSGGVAQVVAAQNDTRKGFWLQNHSIYDMWISLVGTAAATSPSLWLPPGTFYELPESYSLAIPNAISLYGSVTGQAFAAMEW